MNAASRTRILLGCLALALNCGKAVAEDGAIRSYPPATPTGPTLLNFPATSTPGVAKLDCGLPHMDGYVDCPTKANGQYFDVQVPLIQAFGGGGPVACIAALPYDKLVVHHAKDVAATDDQLTLQWRLKTAPAQASFVKNALGVKERDDDGSDGDDDFDDEKPEKSIKKKDHDKTNFWLTVAIDGNKKKVQFNHLFRVRYDDGKIRFRCISVDPVIVNSSE